MAKILQNKIPGAELQIVTMAGHFGMSHRANEYNKRIKGFLIKQGFIPKGEKKNESKSG
jgi:pimeloyl-ACP methyl ester carboxylesterase